MKDYRLSEIKEICEEKCNSCSLKEIPCKSCKMQEICKTLNWQKYHRGFSPNNWDIEPRDMIELPCKIPMIAINEQALAYQVVYRSILGTGEIVTRIFDNETDADVFLSYCKKRNN